jgi:hypothetical protein
MQDPENLLSRGHRRVDHAGHQGIYPHALGGMIDGDRLGEGRDRALRGDVGGVVADARLRELRAHGDDGPRFGREHGLDGVMHPEIGALHIDVEGAVPRLLVDRVDRAAERDAGRRHQHVDPAPLLQHAGHAGLRLGVGAHIGLDRERPGDLRRHFGETRRVAVDQRHPGAFGGEKPGSRGADAGSAAGNDGNLVLELHDGSLA